MPACTDNTLTPDHILNLFTQTKICFQAYSLSQVYPVLYPILCINNNTREWKRDEDCLSPPFFLLHFQVLLSTQKKEKWDQFECLNTNNHTWLMYNLGNHKVVYLNHTSFRGKFACLPQVVEVSNSSRWQW